MTCVSYADTYIISNRLNESEIQYQNGGTVYTWGNVSPPGQIPGLANVKRVYSAQDSYAALLEDGSVYVWGNTGQIGAQGYLYINESKVANVKTIRTTYGAFTAILNNGDIIVWGDASLGGNPYNYQFSSGYSAPVLVPNVNTRNVYSSSGAFALVSTNGDVYVWGNIIFGGSVSGNFYKISGLNNVKTITANYSAFAFLLNDGTVYTWGDLTAGGANTFSGTSSGIIPGLTDVKAIYSTGSSFAGLKNDGTVFIWGNPLTGGGIDGINAYTNLPISGATNIYNTGGAFCAQLNNQVYIWGHPQQGGNINFSGTYSPSYISDIVNVSATTQAFAGITVVNQIYVWGNPGRGGSNVYGDASQKGIISIANNIAFINSTGRAFSAILNDGIAIRWGDTGYGGGNTGNPEAITNIVNVEYVYSNLFSFFARNNSGVFYAWGDSSFGGNNTQVSGISNFTDTYNNWKSYAVIEGASSPIDIVNTPATEPEPSPREDSGISSVAAGFIGVALAIFIFISFYFISKVDSETVKYILVLISLLITAGAIVGISFI